MKKRGRPVTGAARNNRVMVRLSDEEIKMLDYICKKVGEKRSNVLRDCLKMRHNLALYQD